MNNIKDKFSFLTATRFWALVIGAVMFYLKTKNIIGEAEMILANTILGGFIITKTIDRASEQKTIAAGITKGSVDVNTLSGIPQQE